MRASPTRPKPQHKKMPRLCGPGEMVFSDFTVTGTATPATSPPTTNMPKNFHAGNSQPNKFANEVIAEWPLSPSDRVRVSLDLYKGRPVINCRRWWLSDSGELRPGKAGIAFSVRHLPRLFDAVQEALAVATQRGLIDPAYESPRELRALDDAEAA